MEVTNLLTACCIALISVFTLLGFIAVIMNMITALFPPRERTLDPVLVAAISTTVTSVYPGARVTRIEEK